MLRGATSGAIRVVRIASRSLAGNPLISPSIASLDFDIEVTGFEMGEIDQRIAALEDTLAAGSDPADILPSLARED